MGEAEVDEKLRLDARANFTTYKFQTDGYQVYRVQGKEPLVRARQLANIGNGVSLPIWSQDLPNPNNIDDLKGKKCFYVGAYAPFKEYYRSLDPKKRKFYEILEEDCPTRLYVDVDMQRNCNNEIDEETLGQKLQVLVDAITTLANTVRGMPENTPLEYIVLDSSKPDKVSKHFVFNLYLKNNYHCGAFMRCVRNILSQAHESSPGRGDADKDHPFYLWSEVKDPTKPKSGITMLVRTFLADLAVYTMRRNFRLYLSFKGVLGGLPLLKEGASANEPPDWDFYDKTILQYRTADDVVYECLEEDGSEPISTSDTNLFRHDVVAASISSSSSKMPVAITPAYHLQTHWETVYPYDLVFNFLAAPVPKPEHSANTILAREFRFAFHSGQWSKERFFTTADEFKKCVLKELPSTIHVGQVHRFLSHGNAESIEQYQPSLAVDFDINDTLIDRPCCGTNKMACDVCWPIASFAQRAVKAFGKALDLGDAVCFFSGGRGVHIWLTGSNVPLAHTRESRTALVDYLQSATGPTTRAEVFPDYPANVSPSFVREALGSESDRAFYTNFIKQTMKLRAPFDRHAARYGTDSAIVHALWPVLDENVSKDPKHKIKSPFCVHARTSQICIWLKDPSVNPYATTIDPVANISELRMVLSQQKEVGGE